MKKSFFSLLLFVLLLAGGVSIAQNSILAGKITDENNNPVPCAIIKVHQGHSITTAKTDKDGLYYTTALQAGSYRITITANGKENTAQKVTIGTGKEKDFYNFRLENSKAIAEVTTADPFMAAKMMEIKKEDPRHIFLYGQNKVYGIIMVDSSGKVKGGVFSGTQITVPIYTIEQAHGAGLLSGGY